MSGTFFPSLIRECSLASMMVHHMLFGARCAVWRWCWHSIRGESKTRRRRAAVSYVCRGRAAGVVCSRIAGALCLLQPPRTAPHRGLCKGDVRDPCVRCDDRVHSYVINTAAGWPAAPAAAQHPCSTATAADLSPTIFVFWPDTAAGGKFKI